MAKGDGGGEKKQGVGQAIKGNLGKGLKGLKGLGKPKEGEPAEGEGEGEGAEGGAEAVDPSQDAQIATGIGKRFRKKKKK